MNLTETKRQNNRSKPACTERNRGEAPKSPRPGSEVSAAAHGRESPAETWNLMEEVCQRDNLRMAHDRVKANKGSPGIDKMTVNALYDHLKEHWPGYRNQLLSGTYRPSPVKRVEIPKPGGGVRKLGIPTVVDRFIQQAVMQVLQRYWDRTFSEHSYGFRPRRSAHLAVAQAQEYIRQGHSHVVDMDLEKFFDRVNHDILMGLIARRVKDKRVLKLIRAFLNAGVMEGGLASPTMEGTPQGGPLSPLLSNVMLDVLDRELEKRGHCFVRYADDCNIYVRSAKAGERVMQSIRRYLAEKLKLQVNVAKSAVARPGKRKFLGFSFTSGKEPKRRIAPQALARCKQRIRELTHQGRNLDMEKMVQRLSIYLSGWKGYFGFCETPSTLKTLDSWIRRRLRMLLWREWKQGRKRFAELRKLGGERTWRRRPQEVRLAPGTYPAVRP